MKALGLKLTKPQLRALRILAEHDEVRTTNRTSETPAYISGNVAYTLGDKGLARTRLRSGGLTSWWCITPEGRQVLAEHDAGGGQ